MFKPNVNVKVLYWRLVWAGLICGSIWLVIAGLTSYSSAGTASVRHTYLWSVPLIIAGIFLGPIFLYALLATWTKLIELGRKGVMWQWSKLSHGAPMPNLPEISGCGIRAGILTIWLFMSVLSMTCITRDGSVAKFVIVCDMVIAYLSPAFILIMWDEFQMLRYAINHRRGSRSAPDLK